MDSESDHGFKNFQDAKEWAKNNIVCVLTNEETGGKGEIRISNTAIGKILSKAAVEKSNNVNVHLLTLKALPKLIKVSVDAE